MNSKKIKQINTINIMILTIFSLIFISCADKRASAIETTKLFVKHTTNKNVKKLHELLVPKEAKILKKDKKYLLRFNSQINRYHVKEIKKVTESNNKTKEQSCNTGL